MLQYYIQIRLIFILHIIIHVNCGISQENNSSETLPFHKQTCESLLKNCFCDYREFDDVRRLYKDIVYIECKNKADFSNFSRILQSGDFSDLNQTFTITFSDIKHLPAGALSGLHISILRLNGQDITVDEDIFKGILYLRKFYILESSIKDIPDFRFLKDSIRIINFDSSRLTSLEGKNLQNLTLAWILSFSNNSIRYIHPDVFKGTENVEYLTLSHNLLTFISPKLLDSMQKLRGIYISNNNFHHVENLFSIPPIEVIDLGFNNISDTDSILHFNMDDVDRLILSGNPIKELSEDSILKKVPKVRYLFLDHCRLHEFDGENFLQLNLKILDLSHNLIEDLRKPLHSSDSPTISVELLYLSGNKLQNLTNMLRLRNNVKMHFDRNEIKYLTDEDFKNMDPIETLHLEENKIQLMDTNTFQTSKETLKFLDLSVNLIQSLNGSVRYLTNLKVLNLSYNSIQLFAEDEFVGLSSLVDLYLQNNQIKAFGLLQNLPALIHLSISHNDINDIELIRPDQIPESLTLLHFAGNPMKCDCRLHSLILRFNESNHSLTDTDLCLQSDFVSSLHKSSICAETCSCGCTNNGEVSFMSVDCSSRNLSVLPDFLKNSFMKMEDKLTVTSDYWRPFVTNQNIHPLTHFEDHVLEINLENNNLESLEAIELHPNLIQLYLANNKLRRLPEFIFNNLKNLKRVSLSVNPWECDCNTIKFKNWLTSNYAIIQDFNDTRCGIGIHGDSGLSGKIIWTLADLDICPTNTELVVSAAIFGLIFLILCLSAKILYSKYELNIKVFLYFYGFTCLKEKDLDHDKIFDAFLSFSHMDAEFVAKEIIPEIENKAPGVRLCIHYRDFLAGELIHNNITYAVENSKRTVIFLTRNFLESEWCLMEFQAAHIQALKDKVQRIIVIKIGDLPKKIDPQIQDYLDSTTYLTWGEKYFWRKLFYALPTSSNITNAVLRNPRNNVIVINDLFSEL